MGLNKISSQIKKMSPSANQIVDFLSAIKMLQVIDGTGQGKLSEALLAGDMELFWSRLNALADNFFKKDSPKRKELFNTLAVIFTAKFATKVVADILKG